MRTDPFWLLCVALAGVAEGNGRGFSYLNQRDPEVPWSIHVLKVERSDPDLEFHTTLGQSNTFWMTRVSDQVRSLPPALGLPVAAVNGDFYNNDRNYRGRPRELQIRRGELVTGPSGHPCFWIDPAGVPHMTNLESRLRVVWPDGTATPFDLNDVRGEDQAVLYTSAIGASTRTHGGVELILERGTNTAWLPLRAGESYAARVQEVRQEGDSPVNGETLVLSLGPRLAARLPTAVVGWALQVVTETVPSLRGVETAIGGGPTLVRGGKVREWSGLQLRHPRTALGWNDEAIYLVEVDGRQGRLSVGMSFPELASYMRKLGCTEAMNLDGGGSATFWVMGNVMNSPSEGRERPAPNALVVVEKRPRTK